MNKENRNLKRKNGTTLTEYVIIIGAVFLVAVASYMQFSKSWSGLNQVVLKAFTGISNE